MVNQMQGQKSLLLFLQLVQRWPLFLLQSPRGFQFFFFSLLLFSCIWVFKIRFKVSTQKLVEDKQISTRKNKYNIFFPSGPFQTVPF